VAGFAEEHDLAIPVAVEEAAEGGVVKARQRLRELGDM
jgi:hypothetical protein